MAGDNRKNKRGARGPEKFIGKYSRHAVIGFTALTVLFSALFILTRINRGDEGKAGQDEEEIIASISSLTEEEQIESYKEDALKDLIKDYERFGVVKTGGYINMRSVPDELDMTNIIGKLTSGAACDVIEENGDWMLVKSGPVTGYVRKEYIIEGGEAVDTAWENIRARVIVETDVLNIRSAPELNPENVIGKARNGERYDFISVDGDWARIDFDTIEEGGREAYVNIGNGNAEVRICLDAARKIDLRAMALTQYDNMVLSYPDGGFINIRKEPENDGINNVCGKLLKGCGAELLETVENGGGVWYRIRSGDVTGYVSADYCLTGQSAKDTALEYTELTAFVNVDSLNVRSEPSLDARVWTSITKNQAYAVLGQFDGWVEIELDSSDSDEEGDRAFVSTRDNNVEVRYGLPEAIEYYPAIEAANAAAAFRNSIVNYASQFVGNPYVWGGTSLTKGADCSGFTQSVMAHFGIYLPRVSRDQAGCGVRVTSDNMKPGDLIFYANSEGTINHVGIYIGNGQVISAASQKSGIRISRWNYRTPAAIRNVIGS